jgi:hypothetical protein
MFMHRACYFCPIFKQICYYRETAAGIRTTAHNYTNMHPMGEKLFETDRQTDGPTDR